MDTIIELFTYDFFVNAFLASLLAAISCGIVGTYIVSRRIVFISGGITHASFGGIGMGYYLGINPLFGAGIFAILSGMGIQLFSSKGKVREDSSIAIWWSLGMAIGIIFVYLTPGYAPNLMSYLFGSILTVSTAELWLMVALSAIIILFFTFFYRTILYISFDEDFARTSNLPVNLFNYLLMILISLTIVLNIRVVGIILILSLLTIPQATANVLTREFGRMMVYSVGFAFLASFVGLLISYFANIPSGATIIFTQVILFGMVKLINSLSSARK